MYVCVYTYVCILYIYIYMYVCIYIYNIGRERESIYTLFMKNFRPNFLSLPNQPLIEISNWTVKVIATAMMNLLVAQQREGRSLVFLCLQLKSHSGIL